MPHRLMTPEETARYLHLPLADFHRLAQDQQVPFEQQGTRRLYRKKEIDSWASRRILGLPEKNLKAYHRQTSSRVAESMAAHHTLMHLLIEPSFINPDLTAKTRSSVLRDMVQLAEHTERLSSDPRDLLDSLAERESLCSTALPGGIALLHPRHHEPFLCTESFIAVARPTDLFFLICCQDDRIHLHVLARLCCMCQQTPLILHLREAETASDMLEAILAAEQETCRHL